MTLFYSISTNGFYDTDLNISFPKDAKPITRQEYTELLEGKSKGKEIVVNKKGKFVLK